MFVILVDVQTCPPIKSTGLCVCFPYGCPNISTNKINRFLCLFSLWVCKYFHQQNQQVCVFVFLMGVHTFPPIKLTGLCVCFPYGCANISTKKSTGLCVCFPYGCANISTNKINRFVCWLSLVKMIFHCCYVRCAT